MLCNLCSGLPGATSGLPGTTWERGEIQEFRESKLQSMLGNTWGYLGATWGYLGTGEFLATMQSTLCNLCSGLPGATSGQAGARLE